MSVLVDCGYHLFKLIVWAKCTIYIFLNFILISNTHRLCCIFLFSVSLGLWIGYFVNVVLVSGCNLSPLWNFVRIHFVYISNYVLFLFVMITVLVLCFFWFRVDRFVYQLPYSFRLCMFICRSFVLGCMLFCDGIVIIQYYCTWLCI